MRFILETNQKIEKDLKLLILIKNSGRKLKIRELDDKYNSRFLNERFLSVAGASDRFIKLGDKNDCTAFGITEYFKENRRLTKREVLYPKSLRCTKTETTSSMSITANLKQNISEEDILIEVTPVISPIEKSTLVMFQLAFVLDEFVDKNTLSKLTSLGKVWSVNFDFHEKIGYGTFFNECEKMLTYPQVFELWVYIPRGHALVASSPRYEGAFKLGTAETQYKITEEFETDENDFAVKLVNRSSKPGKFSVICLSPLLGEKQIAESEKKIKDIEEKIERYPSWGDFIQNMILTVALFSLLIGAIVILAQQAIQGTAFLSPVEKPSWQDIKAYFSASFALIVEISIFIGFTLWGVYTSLKILSENYKKLEFIAFVGLIILGSLGILSQVFQGQDFLRFSIGLISVLFIIFGSVAFLIRISQKS